MKEIENGVIGDIVQVLSQVTPLTSSALPCGPVPLIYESDLACVRQTVFSAEIIFPRPRFRRNLTNRPRASIHQTLPSCRRRTAEFEFEVRNSLHPTCSPDRVSFGQRSACVASTNGWTDGRIYHRRILTVPHASTSESNGQSEFNFKSRLLRDTDTRGKMSMGSCVSRAVRLFCLAILLDLDPLVFLTR